jgi:uncharacterized damage-inducible protein DinB
MSPSVDEHGRPEPSLNADEPTTLLGFLEFQRATFAWKTADLGDDDLRRSLTPSSMTLGGMMKHLALNEDSWFCERFAGEQPVEPWASVDWDADPDWEWRTATEEPAAELREQWRSSVERARRAVEAALATDPTLGQPARAFTWNGETGTLRWIVTHMIEEYARHNGHADLIRESIDGSVGE